MPREVVTTRASYAPGAWLICAGMLVAAAWWLINLFVGAGIGHETPRVSLPGELTVQLEKLEYAVYYQTTVAIPRVPAFTVQVFDAQTGARVAVAWHNGPIESDGYGLRSSKQGTFTAPRRGSYLIVTTTQSPADDARIVFTLTLRKHIARASRGATVIASVCTTVGLVLSLGTALSRRRRRMSRR